MAKLRKVFVYGTLKKGMSNSSYLPNYAIQEMEQATTKGRLYYVSSGGFPCLTLDGDNTIHGELYTIKEKHWRKIMTDMDKLEGCPHLYLREIITVKTSKGEERAWTYVFNAPSLLGEEIESGIFEKPLEINWYSYFLNKYGADFIVNEENYDMPNDELEEQLLGWPEE